MPLYLGSSIFLVKILAKQKERFLKSLFFLNNKIQKSKADLQFFTHQEQETLNLIALGYKDNEIAELLHSSERSIQKYQTNVLRKMNLHDISSAIEYALEKGLLRIICA
jgi:DNA-binding NarL/FixJ family response regulator